jgi:hypothetical protein
VSDDGVTTVVIDIHTGLGGVVVGHCEDCQALLLPRDIELHKEWHKKLSSSIKLAGKTRFYG